MMMKRKINQASASVVDGNLIISLPTAKNPVVWRMALGEARTAALEVCEHGADHVLVLKYPKGDTIDIAPFTTKEAASAALMAVSQAMSGAHGKINTAAGANEAVIHATPAQQTHTRGVSGWKWVVPLALVILAVFLYSRTADLVPVAYIDNGTPAASGIAGGAADNNATGVPLSADSFLSGM